MSLEDRDLSDSEHWWSEHYEWLDERGYRLRPRYAPGWIGSWKNSKNGWWEAEDGVYQGPSAVVMDATRKSDGAFVTLKGIGHERSSHEKEIAEHLQQDSLASDPKNHCVKILEYLSLPDGDTIFVMPMLLDYDDPIFETVGYFIDCLQAKHTSTPRQSLDIEFFRYSRGCISCINTTELTETVIHETL